MKEIKKIYRIKTSRNKVWEALTDPNEIEKWGAGKAVMDDQVGTDFTLWNGDIWGKNIEAEKDKKLAQEWYGGKWAKPSIVTFELADENSETVLTLTHVNVPDDEIEDIDQGWDDYYLGPMKEYLEN